MEIPYELFGEEEEEFRRAARAFVEKELAPHAEEWERAEAFPREVMRRVGELGFFGLKYPEKYGGQAEEGREAKGILADAVLTEELAGAGSGGVAASIGAQKDLFTLYLYRFGSEEQRQRWLPPALAGEIIGALAVTEPEAGSDVAAIKTRAERVEGGYLLRGTKVFITNGAWADAVVVAARTSPGPGHEGISLFLLEAGTPGFSRRRIRTLGWRTSQTGELVFEDCFVPEENLIGEEGRGFYYLVENFVWERLVMALGAVAGAERVYRSAKEYSLTREAFGRPVGKFQSWRHRFADLVTAIEEAKRLTYHVLRLYLAGQPCLKEAAMAKAYATEVAFLAADEALQVHGGYGYMMEYPVQRAWRDARLGPIGGGTSEIMREIVARSLSA